MKKAITLVLLFALMFAPGLALADGASSDPASQLDRRRGPDPGPGRR